MRVMLVTNDQGSIRDLGALLGAAGYEVIACADSVAAINRVEQLKPDVILLALRMERLNGWQAAYYIRRFQGTAATPIIGLADAGPSPAAAPMRAGIDAILADPIYPLSMIAQIERLATPAARFDEAIPLAGATQ